MRNFLVILFLLMISQLSFSQSYVYIDTDTKGMIQSNAKWVDVNHDGFLDLITTGERFSANKQIVSTFLYLNDKKGNFYRSNAAFSDFYRSSIDWIDYNKDGYKDVLISGETSNHDIITRIYKNSKWMKFTSINPNIIGVRDGSVDVGDYNNDGKEDIAICGENEGSLYSAIYKRVGNNFVNINANLMPLYTGSIEWGDYDNDKDLDLLISGEAADGKAYTKIYKNTNGIFKELNMMIHGINNGYAVWGDFDNDDDLDIFICGESGDHILLTRFYKNDGNDEFTVIKPPIPGARDGYVQVADYDCDNDLDILISGETALGTSVRIYANQGDFEFTEVDTYLPGVYLGGAYWADYDGDCDNDVFIIGLDDCNNMIAKLYRNDMQIEAQPEAKYTPNERMWMPEFQIKEQPNYYYFVWSSCYCNPGRKEGNSYHMYISNVHYLRRTYELQMRFNGIIIQSLPDWGNINGGHRVSIGYKTKAEAEAARRQVIKDYKSELFTINYVNW